MFLVFTFDVMFMNLLCQALDVPRRVAIVTHRGS